MSEQAPRRRIGGQLYRIPVVHAEGPEGARKWAPAVGITPLDTGRGVTVAVVVRAAYAIPSDDGPTVMAKPIERGARVAVDQPSRFASPGLLDEASDFAPRKAAIDVVVVGHAHARRPEATIHGRLELAEPRGGKILVASFFARAGAPSDRIPLTAPYLGGIGTTGVTRFAPTGSDERFLDGGLPEPLDPEIFQVAPPELRAPLGAVPPNAMLELVGLLPVAATDELVLDGAPPGLVGSPEALEAAVVARRSVLLPGYQPVVSYEISRSEPAMLEMTLDTLRIDTDAQRIDVVWRGMTRPIGDLVDLHRIIVSMEHLGLERDASTRMSDTQRGSVVFATTEEDAERGETPPEDDVRLEAQRYRTLAEVAPEPRIPLERYASITAELSEWPDRRAETLSRHGYDEDGYGIEERAWLERFASNAMDGQSELAASFGQMFLEAQDALARPEEERLGLRDYAGLRAELDRAADASAVLEQAGLTLAQWMRLERRWLARADTDPRVARELESLLEELSDDSDPFADEAEPEAEA